LGDGPREQPACGDTLAVRRSAVGCMCGGSDPTAGCHKARVLGRMQKRVSETPDSQGPLREGPPPSRLASQLHAGARRTAAAARLHGVGRHSDSCIRLLLVLPGCCGAGGRGGGGSGAIQLLPQGTRSACRPVVGPRPRPALLCGARQARAIARAHCSIRSLLDPRRHAVMGSDKMLGLGSARLTRTRRFKHSVILLYIWSCRIPYSVQQLVVGLVTRGQLLNWPHLRNARARRATVQGPRPRPQGRISERTMY
jgi:hypothetical protein